MEFQQLRHFQHQFMQQNKINLDVMEFLYESNMIESQPDGLALLDSVKAWEFIVPKEKLELIHILLVHEKLMSNLNPRIAGQIRSVNVWVNAKPGTKISDILPQLEELLKKEPKTWKEIKQWHIDFEGIHPFEDGNGRTGRIIMNWQRIKNNLPIQIIKHGYEQSLYYEWFN